MKLIISTILFFLLILTSYGQKITEKEIYNKGVELDLIRNSLQSIFDTMDDYDKHDFAFYVINDISLTADVLEAKILNIIDLIRIKNLLQIDENNTDYNNYISWRFSMLNDGFVRQVDWLKKTKSAMKNSNNLAIASQVNKLIKITEYLKDSSTKITKDGL